MFGMYHPRFDRGYNMHAWVEALWNGTMWCFGVVTPGRFMWSGQVWFSLLSCSTALEMLLTFSGLVKKKKKNTCKLCLKNPKKIKAFNCYFLSQGQCALKSWLIIYPLITLWRLSHDRRPVNRLYLQPLRKNPLAVFTSHRR